MQLFLFINMNKYINNKIIRSLEIFIYIINLKLEIKFKIQKKHLLSIKNY